MPVTRLLRQSLARAGAGRTRRFRWRGGEVSRIEGFTDAVSIVVALLVPYRMVGLAGYAYFLFGVAFGIHGALAGRRLRKIEVLAA